ncbi:hypothetical protein ACHAXR_008392 [Thalassiosira sp. AJA248-18]
MSKPDSISMCKCVKSKCLKLYCECYSQGITCNEDCVCIDCKNTKEQAGGGKSEENDNDNMVDTTATTTGSETMAVDKSSHEPRRGSDRSSDLLKSKKNGCACKNSKCLKKYCVCFNAGVECGVGRCKCINCKNPNGAISNHAKSTKFGSLIEPPKVRTTENTKCRCSKTNCLKLYCDCFRQDLECNPTCRCVDCQNTERHSGPMGARTQAREEYMKTRPTVFQTPKKKSGGGCSCLRNKCSTKYCDCNSRGVGCDPAVCTCINCANMMKPESEMVDNGLEKEDEVETEVFIPSEADHGCKVKGLQIFAHLINDCEERRISDPSEKLNIAYLSRELAAEATKKVMEEESNVRGEIEEEIAQLEERLKAKLNRESVALESYHQRTNKVMCLEMEEPCRWNSMYQKLKEYVMKTGDLPPVPSACTNEYDRKLSIWVQEMKSLVYSKSERITNAPHRIEALESLGIEWVESSEEHWRKMHDRLAAYKRQHKTVRLPSFMHCRKSKDKDLIALRHWVDSQEQHVKSGDMAMDKLKKLQKLELPLKLTWEQKWDYYIVELLKFRSKYGHLNLSGKDHQDLSDFVSEVVNRLPSKKARNVKLTKDEMFDLRSKGLLNDLSDLKKNPGRPSATGGKVESMNLVPLERVKEVNYWAGMLEHLKAYHAEYGHFEFPTPHSRKSCSDFVQLRDWVEAQRSSYANKTLEDTRIKELTNLGFVFDPWNSHYMRLKQFKREAGTARLPKVYKSNGGEEDEELAELTKWLQEQVNLYRRDELEKERKKKLRKLGVYFTKGHMGKVAWIDRFEEMMEFYHTNKTCLPERDGPLRQWVLELVDLIQNGYVSNKRQQLIDQEHIGPYLRPEVIFKDSGNKKKRKAAPSDDSSSGDKKIKAEEFAAV